jgi:hypothetical protein
MLNFSVLYLCMLFEQLRHGTRRLQKRSLISQLGTHNDVFAKKYACFYGLCPGRESNPHALRQGILSPLCLPFHHPGIALEFTIIGFQDGKKSQNTG